MLRFFLITSLLFTSLDAKIFEPGEPLVQLKTTEGVQRLQRCAYRKNFDLLSPYYLEDLKPEVSGVASAVMVLNALNLTAFKIYRPKNDFYFTTDYFLSKEARQTVISNSTIKTKKGVRVKTLKKALESFCLEVVDIKHRELRMKTLRSQLKSLLNDEHRFIIGYFAQSASHIKGSVEYYSPIGAYDIESDSVLVMDVDRRAFGPYWISTEALFDSTKKGGGLLIVGTKFIPLSSEAGQRNLKASAFCGDYWRLYPYFQKQINATYCGVASAVTVINALSAEKTSSFLTQEAFFTDQISESIVTKAEVTGEKGSSPGLNIFQLQRIFNVYGCQAEVRIGDTDLNACDFRILLKQVLSDEKTFMVANFLQPAVGQRGVGHLCPLVAYEESTDSVLILDVGKRPPFWVSVETVLQAIKTPCTEGTPRGYLLVSR